MLDLNLIREKPDLVRTALKNRQQDASPVDAILSVDEKRRSLLTEVEHDRRARVVREVSALLALVARVEAEAVLVDAAEQDDPRRRRTRRVCRRHDHRVPVGDTLLLGTIDPARHLFHRVRGDVTFVQLHPSEATEEAKCHSGREPEACEGDQRRRQRSWLLVRRKDSRVTWEHVWPQLRSCQRRLPARSETGQRP